jgi:OHCU decarboxylase
VTAPNGLVPLATLNALAPAAFADALRPLFETADPLARALLGARPFASYVALIDHAARLAGALTEAEQIEVVNAHPRIGESAARMSAISAREQGAATHDPDVDADLAGLNAAYEQAFGFRFVVFVNRRPRSAVADVLRQRLHNDRAAELDTALRELFAIARDRLATFEPR